MWIQFTGPWCPNCTRMERDSFPHPAVVQHARDSFIPVKLRSDVDEQLALSFNLSGLPATIILSPDREILASHQGYLGPDEFEAFLRESLSLSAEKPGIRERDAVPNAAQGSPERQALQPTNEEPLALAGYCPVSLVRDRKLVLGQTKYTVSHAGWKYRFTSLDSSDCFRKEPNSYVPPRTGRARSTRWTTARLVRAIRGGASCTGAAYSFAPPRKTGGGFSRIPIATR